MQEQSSKLDDLTDFDIDPLDTLIGFYSVVGKTKPTIVKQPSIVSVNVGQ